MHSMRILKHSKNVGIRKDNLKISEKKERKKERKEEEENEKRKEWK